MGCGKKEKVVAESSASDGALFKENLPRAMNISTADVFMNKKIDPTKEKGLGLETSAEEDTLMGRLAKRMSSRDFIDNLDLGTRSAQQAKKVRETSDGDSKVVKEISEDDVPKKMSLSSEAMKTGVKIEHEHDETVKKLLSGKAKLSEAPSLISKDHLKEFGKYYDKKEGLPAMEKKLEKADNTVPAPNGMGLFKQMEDIKAQNFSDPIPLEKVMPGNNMADQAKNAGNVVGLKGWDFVGDPS